MDTDSRRSLARGISYGRLAIGLSALVLPGVALRLFAFPKRHDNSSARMVGRFFGIREALVAAFTLNELAGGGSLDRRRLYQLNAMVDGADAAVATLTLLGRRGISAAALMSGVVAASFAGAWLWLAGQES